MNPELIQKYIQLQDAGLSDAQIDMAFQRHLGVSLADVRQSLSPQSELGSGIVQDATSQAYADPDVEVLEKFGMWPNKLVRA